MDSSLPKKRKTRAGQSVKNVNLDAEYKKLLNCLARDTKALLTKSHAGALPKEDALTLTNYLKLVKELKKSDDEHLSQLSDSQLKELIAKKSKP